MVQLTLFAFPGHTQVEQQRKEISRRKCPLCGQELCLFYSFSMRFIASCTRFLSLFAVFAPLFAERGINVLLSMQVERSEEEIVALRNPANRAVVVDATPRETSFPARESDFSSGKAGLGPLEAKRESGFSATKARPAAAAKARAPAGPLQKKIAISVL